MSAIGDLAVTYKIIPEKSQFKWDLDDKDEDKKAGKEKKTSTSKRDKEGLIRAKSNNNRKVNNVDNNGKTDSTSDIE